MRGQYSTDDLMPDLFFAPYVDLDPDLDGQQSSADRTE
jgi:hypothetical protein